MGGKAVTKPTGNALKALVRAYGKGSTIRQLADANGYSYGSMREILIAGGAELRLPGGARPRP
jgi:helix-turn-helix protein